MTHFLNSPVKERQGNVAFNMMNFALNCLFKMMKFVPIMMNLSSQYMYTSQSARSWGPEHAMHGYNRIYASRAVVVASTPVATQADRCALIRPEEAKERTRRCTIGLRLFGKNVIAFTNRCHERHYPPYPTQPKPP